jgi:Methyltransferase domain
LLKPVPVGADRPVYTIENAGEKYLVLLAAAHEAAREITRTPSLGLVGAAEYIHRAGRELLASSAGTQPKSAPAGEAVFECLRRLVEVWPEVASRRIEGERVFSAEPGLWKRAMTDWPMGGFARMAADFMIENELLGGNILELGAGVGSCSALVASHVTERYIRTDLQPFLLKRQKLPGTVDCYDFNEEGRWQDLDTIFAVNALHCAKDKTMTLRHLWAMLRKGGVVVLGEGRPHTDDSRTPWALNPLFGLFRGWWDIGGFVPREDWLAAFQGAGFAKTGYAVRREGSHDLGGLVWAVK